MRIRVIIFLAITVCGQGGFANPSDEQSKSPTSAQSIEIEPEQKEAETVTKNVELSASEAAEIKAALRADNDDAPLNLMMAPPPNATNTAGRGGVSMNPDIALIFDVAGAYFSEDETGQLGAHDPMKTGFTLQQLEMHAESRVDPYFDFQTNLVFSEFGVEVEEVYARTLSVPYGLQVKAGQFLLPYGRANPTHPHAWNFVDQTLMLGKFMGGEGGRGLGAEMSWLSPLPWYAKLTVGLSQPSGECCSRSYFSPLNPPINGLEDFIYFARLEQFWELARDWSLLVGTSQVKSSTSATRTCEI